MRIILIVAASLIIPLLSACSSSGGYNPTVFEFQYDKEKLAGKPIKKVILAPVSLGAPPPSYLRKSDRKVKAMVKDYLESNGMQVLPTYQFDNAWQKANRTYGDIYDPTTGKVDLNAWRGAMVTVGEVLREQTDAQMIIFADLIEHDVQHSNSMQHYARWYGVTRKPALRGSGGVPVGFDWSQNIKAASLSVVIFDVELNRIFVSRGGLDTLYELDLKRSTPAFVRRKSLLKSESDIEEGIAIAFHPFIPMKRYPGIKD